VPVGAPAGALSFTVSDGSMSNALDYQQMASEAPKSATQLVSFLNNLRPNTNAYVRVWRTDPAFQVQGQDFARSAAFGRSHPVESTGGPRFMGAARFQDR
jgi:hypothetical protein